jgi:cyclopropane fatty-acyl-phospholipid synthase-like methyltransferase
MSQTLSPRLAEIVDALPLRAGMRVLEIGCGPGAAARAVLERIGDGCVLAIDRSAKAIARAKAGSRAELATGRLEFRQVAIENFVLAKGEKPYDLAFAVRVGALDGRHPETGVLALQRIREALSRNGRLFVDGGNPLKEIALDAVARRSHASSYK